MAYIIYPNAPKKYIEPSNGTDFSLEELQSIVGGYIEVIWLDKFLGDEYIMVVNEEGKLLGLPSNHEASSIAWQPIVGTALLCRASEVK